MKSTQPPDIECPYCGDGQDIDHDDGYGREEGETHQQECGNCDKTFAYTTSVTFYYEASEAPCLNGSPHNFKETKHDYSFLTKKDGRNFLLTRRCKDCDYQESEWVKK